MNTPWIIGLLISIAFFAYFEKRAFDFPKSQNTLSRWIYDMGRNWPLSIWLMGMLAGGLAVHFFWHWCPAGSISEGMLSPHALDVFNSNCTVMNSTTGECLSRGHPL